MAVYDQEWVKANGDDAPAKQVMGTGPFLFKQYTRGTEVIRERNPKYWNKGLPYLDGIKHLIVPDPNTSLAVRPGGPWSLSEEEILKLPDYDKDKTKDIERARMLPAEAGFPNGFDALIKTSTGQAMADHTIFIIAELKKIGVNATMTAYEAAEIYNIENGGDFDLATRTRMAANADDPDSIYTENHLCNAQRNWSKLCIPQVDELFLRQSQELDLGEAEAAGAGDGADRGAGGHQDRNRLGIGTGRQLELREGLHTPHSRH